MFNYFNFTCTVYLFLKVQFSVFPLFEYSESNTYTGILFDSNTLFSKVFLFDSNNLFPKVFLFDSNTEFQYSVTSLAATHDETIR